VTAPEGGNGTLRPGHHLNGFRGVDKPMPKKTRTIRFIEPSGRPGRPFNAWIRKWPLLGPITLASFLQERGYDVAVYNENLSGPVLENPDIMADLCAADVVGISIMTPTANRGYQIADAIRSRCPDVTIAFGGVHATFRPQEARRHGDVVVQGEGESVIQAVADGRIRQGIVRGEPVENLDTLPVLNHGLMHDFEALVAGCRRREHYELPVMTSRGCPFGCDYCTVTRMFGRRVRRQSVDKVHADIQAYASRGFRRMFFYDDNFTTDRAWSRDLLERLKPMDLRFNAQVRVDFHWKDRHRRRRDDDLLRAMRRAGGDVFYIGYETIDDATARQWHKGYRGEGTLTTRLMEDTHILHDNGFWIHGMFVLGPQHTERTAEEIVQFARRSRLETLQISVLTPFPGTPLMERFRPHLTFTDFPGDWDYYDGTHCVYNHGRLGIERLQKVLLDAHRHFYRWSGLGAHRLRKCFEQKIGMGDKLALLWKHAQIARNTLKAWKTETAAFLETCQARTLGAADP